MRRGEAGLCGDLRLMYTELHARSAFSFSREHRSLEGFPSASSARHGGNGGTRSRWGLWSAAILPGSKKKIGVRARVFGAEVACLRSAGVIVFVESREGSQNLCRAITRHESDTKKAKDISQPNWRQGSQADF